MLNQADFSTLEAVKLQTQSRYEQGLTEPGVEHLALLAELGVDVAYVLTARRSVNLIDETSSAIVTAVRALDATQQLLLLAFLVSLDPAAPPIADVTS